MAKTLIMTMIAAFGLAGAGCASKTKDLPEMKPVEKVDLDRYMGEWYVIAAIPTGAESDAHNAVEKYTWNKEKKRVEIEYRYNKGSFDGTPKSIFQSGFIQNENTNAEWTVQPVWPFSFSSIIVDIAKDYSDTVVADPNRNYVWIMSRKPKLEPARFRKLVGKVRSLGYDVRKLRMVPQGPLEERIRTE